MSLNETPNGVRYPRVGGTGQRHLSRNQLQATQTALKTRQTPTRRVHAVLATVLRLAINIPLLGSMISNIIFRHYHRQMMRLS